MPKICAPLILVGSILLQCAGPLAAEVVSDGSLGRGMVHQAGNRYRIPGDAGLLKGDNLFQSFRTFDLKAGESAVFRDLGGVKNVLARVTGGRSSIDGTISCGANLFLMNPSGLVFGPNAALD